jgi:uncharacterized membrane protein
LLHREVQRWLRANQNPADTFRGFYVSNAKANELLVRPFNHSWGDMTALPLEEAQAYEQALAQAADQVEAIIQQAQWQQHRLRLQDLVEVFGLDRFELDVLLICLAPALDQGYEQLYGYLQDNVNHKRPSISMILNLLGQPGLDRLGLLTRFTDETPLFKYFLLERVGDEGAIKTPLLTQMLHLDHTIVTWLLGKYRPHPDLGSQASLQQPWENETDLLLGSRVLDYLDPILAENPILVCHGPDQASQQAAARLLAARANRPLLTVNLAALIDKGLARLHALKLALRDARLTGAIPFIEGWDACLVDGSPTAELLTELCTFPDLVLVAGQADWQARGGDRAQNLFWLSFPKPDYAQRQARWRHFLSHSVGEPSKITALAGQFVLTTDQIRDAVTTAQDAASQARRPLNEADLFAAARAHSSSRLSNLAHKITSRYGWDDIILPDDQRQMLREIVTTVQGRAIVLESWGAGEKLASSRGVTVLFAGPPGTGKTMAAEIIAGELGLDLYKIDLSTVVSKYIGETEKNLERIFSEAQSSNAILFFDEADALFGKRSEVKDAHDRYANIEVSYLLQRMEAYDGVTILATNLRTNLDDAFTRRLHFSIDFPLPNQADRLRIWQALFPPTIPRDPGIDFDILARRFKLAGGNIRNIIVSAAYLAAANGGAVTMDYLLHGTRRELQKMGRLIGADDLRL